MVEDYFFEDFELRVLWELNFVINCIIGFGFLMKCFCVLVLEKFDILFNCFNVFLIGLCEVFLFLIVFLVLNNYLIELILEVIMGLKIVDVMNNDILYLNLRIGFFGGEGGFECLDVMGNCFCVLRFNVLERGIEVILRWF